MIEIVKVNEIFQRSIWNEERIGLNIEFGEILEFNKWIKEDR